MTLGDLIKSNNWLSVEQTYCSLFPDQIEAIDAYRELYHNLQLTAPFASNITIILEIFSEDPDNSYVDVSGRTKAPTQDITESLALEFVSWKEWLGMTIEGKTTQSFTQLEIICHCLNEMTFFGFDESEIQKQLNELKSIESEYNKMTNEDKRKNTKTLDDIFRDNKKKKNQ